MNVKKYRLRLIEADGRTTTKTLDAWLDLEDNAQLRAQLISLIPMHTNLDTRDAEKALPRYGLQVLHEDRDEVLRVFKEAS